MLIFGLGSALSACSGSTSFVDQTYVTISSASPLVLRGDQRELIARLWTRTSPSDPTVASGTATAHNTTIAAGINSGVVQIRATATGFQGPTAAATQGVGR